MMGSTEGQGKIKADLGQSAGLFLSFLPIFLGQIRQKHISPGQFISNASNVVRKFGIIHPYEIMRRLGSIAGSFFPASLLNVSVTQSI